MKNYLQYNKEKAEGVEELFLKLSHIDELDIKFDFIECSHDLYYFYKGGWIFIHHKENNHFIMNRDKINDIIKDRFSLSVAEMNLYMESMVEKHLKIYGLLNLLFYYSISYLEEEEHFNN